jgi:hypothetical protein
MKALVYSAEVPSLMLFWGVVNRGEGKGVREIYLDEVVEDGLKVLIGAVMERVDYLAAWKFPLRFPQGLDAVMMRHTCLERLGAHDPVPTTRTPILARSLAAHDVRVKLAQTMKTPK